VLVVYLISNICIGRPTHPSVEEIVVIIQFVNPMF
jgi:hypothetical protein